MSVEMIARFLTFIVISTVFSVSSMPKETDETGSSDQSLVLSPMIEKGDIQNAQDLCKVQPLEGNITSYAGFITVDSTYNSNFFFWFFPASTDYETAPVLVWIFNGAGAATMFSVFIELGPYEINDNLSLSLRGPSVTKNFSVVYIDIPAGAGFSFADSENGYSDDYDDVGFKLYLFLVQFFTLFPGYQSNDFFFLGESFGGKCVVTASYAIHMNNPSADVKINLKGLAVGNAVIDTEIMLRYGNYLYQIGLIDADGKQSFHEAEERMLQLILEKKYSKAADVFDSTILGFYTKSGSLLRNLTGYKYISNFLNTSQNTDYVLFNTIPKFLTQPDIRNAIHVGNAAFNISPIAVTDHLKGDLLNSVKPYFEELLENYRVLVFGGQLDLFVPYPLMVDMVDALDWNGMEQFSDAPRTQWYVGDDLAGYSKEGGNLNLVLVRNAGHNPPRDQREWSLDMISRFIRNERFFAKKS